MGAGEVTDMKQTRTRALFATFFKIGAFTFGGGYAMVALLEHEFVEEKQWVTREEFLDMVAIAESTPGPMAVNSATYIGYKVQGVAGGAGSALGTGGMLTKVTAAKRATEAGVDMIITNGAHAEVLYDIVEGKPVGTRFVGRKA